ncbi:MAG TPA: hypothetical protein VL360_01155 [Gammaproteobacteria bacterium]|jgi:hypothetical protein|nr:hypothetical protein [Gammaproteobacteria bacterium]
MKKYFIWAAAIAAALALTGCSTQTYPTTTGSEMCQQCGTANCEHKHKCDVNCKEHCKKACKASCKKRSHHHKKAAAKKAAPATTAPAMTDQPAAAQ